MEEVQVMTKEEVAKLFRVSEHTVDNWRKNNGLPCRRVSNFCRFIRADVLRWFERFEEATKGQDQGKEAEKNDR